MTTSEPQITERHDLCAKLLYLLGGDLKTLNNAKVYIPMDIWTYMQKKRNCEIIRHLCCIRNVLLINSEEINNALLKEKKDFWYCHSVITTSLGSLSALGVKKVPKQVSALAYIQLVSGWISARIENCKEEVDAGEYWHLLKKAVMMQGQSAKQIKKAQSLFVDDDPEKTLGLYANIPKCPLLEAVKNDDALIWAMGGKTGAAVQPPKALNVQQKIARDCILTFLDAHKATTIFVDCENVDPFFLCAALSVIPGDRRDKLNKVVLIDSEQSSVAWRRLPDHVSGIQISHIYVDPIKSEKMHSMVDMRMAVEITREKNGSGCIVVTSDSDIYGVLDPLNDSRSFLVFLEHKKTSTMTIETYESRKIPYVWIDELTTPESAALWSETVCAEFLSNATAFCTTAASVIKNTCYHARIPNNPALRTDLATLLFRSLDFTPADGEMKVSLSGDQLTADLRRVYESTMTN